MSFSYANFRKACRLSFKGRANRSEFWSFAGFGLIYGAVFFAIAIACGEFLSKQVGLIALAGTVLAMLVYAVFFACVMVRRLHDTGKSGYYALVYYVLSFVTNFFNKVDDSSGIALVTSLLQFVYFIIMMVFMCTKSDPVANEYGDPEQ